MDELVRGICALQSASGAYLSEVTLGFGSLEDANCFVTALVLRELAGIADERVERSRRRALGYLSRSRYPGYRNLFAFYPFDRHPFWMPKALYPDADDTSLVLLALVAHGAEPPSSLETVVAEQLDGYRAVGRLRRHLRRPWQAEGAFLTWLTTAGDDNPIDCCVNTNVCALLARAGLTGTDGYAAACQMVNHAARLVAGGELRPAEATPFYPSTGEWWAALDHAVEAGADALVPAAEALAAFAGGAGVLCASTDGTVTWRAPVLAYARRLRRQALAEGRSR